MTSSTSSPCSSISILSSVALPLRCSPHHHPCLTCVTNQPTTYLPTHSSTHPLIHLPPAHSSTHPLIHLPPTLSSTHLPPTHLVTTSQALQTPYFSNKPPPTKFCNLPRPSLQAKDAKDNASKSTRLKHFDMEELKASRSSE